MQGVWSTLGFVSGSVVTAVVASSVIGLNGQSPRDNAFHVCVGKDRVLRLVETEERCPEGQERLRLQEADTPDVEPPKDTDAKQDKKPDPKTPKPTSSRVQAPFEVVDYHGRTIFRVDDTLGDANVRGLAVYGLNGQPLALVIADHGHGVVRTDSASGKMITSFGASDGFAGLRVRENGQVRADIGRSDGGSYGARVYGSGKVPLAAIGTSTDGTSLVMVSNGTQSLAALGARANKGMIEVTNASGVGIATLSEGTKSGGKLQLTDAGGTPMVEAGNESGIGVVRAGPAANLTQIPAPGGPRSISELKGKR